MPTNRRRWKSLEPTLNGNSGHFGRNLWPSHRRLGPMNRSLQTCLPICFLVCFLFPLSRRFWCIIWCQTELFSYLSPIIIDVFFYSRCLYICNYTFIQSAWQTYTSCIYAIIQIICTYCIVLMHKI